MVRSIDQRRCILVESILVRSPNEMVALFGGRRMNDQGHTGSPEVCPSIPRG